MTRPATDDGVAGGGVRARGPGGRPATCGDRVGARAAERRTARAPESSSCCALLAADAHLLGQVVVRRRRWRSSWRAKATDGTPPAACGDSLAPVPTTAVGGPPAVLRRLRADVRPPTGPGYPAAAVRWLVGAAAPGRGCVDLGAGHRAARDRRSAGLGYDVLAVEPDDGMRAVAEVGAARRGPRPWHGRVAPGRRRVALDAVLAGPGVPLVRPRAGAARDRAGAAARRPARPAAGTSRDDRVALDLASSPALVDGEDRCRRSREVAPALRAGSGRVEPGAVRATSSTCSTGRGPAGLAGSWSYVALRPDRDDGAAPRSAGWRPSTRTWPAGEPRASAGLP